MKTKTAAIRHARKTVGQLYRFGGQYRFSQFDPGANAWRESTPTDYWTATANRQAVLIATAREFLGLDPYADGQYAGYIGGPWTDYVTAP